MANFCYLIVLVSLAVSAKQVYPAVANDRGVLQPKGRLLDNDGNENTGDTFTTPSQFPDNNQNSTQSTQSQSTQFGEQFTESIQPTTVENASQSFAAESVTIAQEPNPPTITPLKCADYACVPGVGSSAVDPACNNKPQTGVRPCRIPGSQNGYCYGIYCLTVTADIDYCICSPEQSGEQCNELKTGSCALTTGTLPPQHYVAQNKRWRQLQAPADTGKVHARHFAATGTDCIRICQWSNGQCNAINYGPVNDVFLCELLSLAVVNETQLEPWLINASGWQFTTLPSKPSF